MADTVEFKLDGLGSLISKLESVSYDLKRKGGRSALRKAAAVISAKVKEGAKRVDDSGTVEDISKNITIRWSSKLFRSTGNLGFRVGVLGGAKEYNNIHTRKGGRRGTYAVGGDAGNPGGDTFYWRFVEFGTSKVAARPFMRPALADSISEATAVFISEYEKAIDRAIKRATKAAGSN
ncbi:MAG TPA: HK97-gp10 family putative phage morphogenesis protein [Pseudomonas sp.]|uniref:HK97-gp10 family putative phage morphogenesis protein n=1 Tax=Pseudomonas sp. TaxID=306 RepID=UPI002EDA717A